MIFMMTPSCDDIHISFDHNNSISTIPVMFWVMDMMMIMITTIMMIVIIMVTLDHDDMITMV